MTFKTTKIKPVSYLVALAVFSISPGRCTAQQRPAEVSCELSNETFAILEPVIVTIRFRNKLGKTVRVLCPVPRSVLQIKVTRKGEELPYLAEEDGRVVPMCEVAPGQTVCVHVNLLEYFDMKRHGEYEVRIRYGNLRSKRIEDDFIPDPPVGLGPIKVIIRYPTDAELRAVNYFRRDRRESAGTWPRQYAMMAAYVALFHQDTAYYKYCYYWMGLTLQGSYHSQEALRSYEKQLDLFPDFPLADEVRFHILTLRHGGNKPETLNPRLRELLKTTRDLEVRRMIEQRLGTPKKKE